MTNTGICHKYLKNICCYSDNYCKYKHIDMNDLLMIDEENNSKNLCRCILSNRGCSMVDFKRCHKTGNLLRLSCEKDKKRNHFIKPIYVCPKHFCYEDCNCYCHMIHISWKTFINNMFKSHIDIDKKRSIEFSTNIINRYIVDEEQHEFNKLMLYHKKAMKLYNQQYNSVCIKCGLKPFKIKLPNIKYISIYVLNKIRHLNPDLIKIIISFLYNKHMCIFPILKNNIIGLFGLSNLSIHGQRVVDIKLHERHVINDNNNTTRPLSQMNMLNNEDISYILKNKERYTH